MNGEIDELLARPRATRAAMVRWDTIEPARWSAGFEALRELGFDGVDLPIVWSSHERDDRSRDFSSARKDVDGVVRAARAAGLSVRVRVGPRCVESEPGYGVARWVLAEPQALARNARRGAVLEPVGLVPAPAPSVASGVYIEASRAWVRAVVARLSERSLSEISEIVLGPGTFAPLRSDAIEGDCHPEAGPLPTDADAREQRAERNLRRYYDALVDAALDGGASPSALRLSLIGTRSSALAASALAASFALDASTPFASTGTDAIWHEVTDAIANSPRGVHFDVACGSAPFARPLRNRDAASAARVVLAAGAASITVRHAWVGDGWVGSLLDPKGVTQRVAMRWRALFDECASIPTLAAADAAAKPSEQSWMTAVYRGWLAQYDLLARPEAHDTLAPLGLRAEPQGSIFARADGATLVAVSACERAATLFDDARRWLEAGQHELAPGAALTMRARGGER